MQSNRSKYSSSPTTGMKTKNMWKKIGLSSDQIDEVPDFASVPIDEPPPYVSGRPDFTYTPQSLQQVNSDYQQPVNQYVPYMQSSQQKQLPNQRYGNYNEGKHNEPHTFYDQTYVQRQVEQVKPAKPAPQSVVPNLPPYSYEPPRDGKMSTSQLLTLFFAVILPFVFAIAFFANSVFYAYIALAAVGAAIMWYREVYSPTLRCIISGALVLTCLFGVIKLVRMPSPSDVIIPNANPIVIQVQPTEDVSSFFSEPDLLLTTVPEATPFVAEKTEAEKRLASFMDLWMTNNKPAMVEYCQLSWVNKQSDPAASLFNMLANRSVEAYTIESISGSETDTSRSVSMTATINKNTGKKSSVYRFTVMMVKEGDQWYVNPNSLATNDEIKDATDEVVVNNSMASGAVTEAPRTTVTPVPPGNTPLYYNPDGGSYYHRDPSCPSVRSEFLPLKGSFPYNELDIYKDTYKLSPCMKCNAPINTIPPN